MNTAQKSLAYRFALGITAAAFAVVAWSAGAQAGSVNKQTAQLYELQAAFHRAATIHDPVNGDSPAVIEQRIRDMLALWTEDGELNAPNGVYIGNGDPSDPATCPTPSSNPANLGTLCTFFKYVAGSFQPGNKFVSLAPSFKTSFDVQGKTASVYFECLYFNIAIDPGTGLPLWQLVSHPLFDGTAQKVHGTWLFSRANPSPPGGIPVP
jgi:hypothetical protein